MHAIRIQRHIDSETLQLPELKELIGKDVEIVVLAEPNAPLQSSTEKQDYSALAQIAGQDLIDPEAYKELRAASLI
jgi:histidinol-phosphate/aromatic aminotransferase/cobyric acid decarboxylase-like protein